MNIYDIFGSGRKPAVTESKIEVVHEYVNEDFSGLMFGANNEDIAGPGGSDNNDSTSPIHGFGEDYDNIPDLENIGEQVVSIMDAERRLAQGDRIFAFHEMDEEPSEIHDVGQLAGYDAEQLLAVPQGVEEGLPQTLRKVVPGHAKREIDRKMDAGKFGKTDADKDANFQRYKKIQDKLKEQGVAEGSFDFDNASPMTKDIVKTDRIRSLKNLIAIAKEQGRQLRVQELELELKKLQGVSEGGHPWDTPGPDLLVMNYYNGGNTASEIAQQLGMDEDEVEYIIHKNEQGVAEGQLDELSPKTLGSYVTKASKDVGTLGYGLGDIKARPGKYKDSPDVVKSVQHSFDKRINGVEKASNRLSKQQGVAEASFDYTMKDLGNDYAGFPSNHSMKHKMLKRIKPEKHQIYKDKMNNMHEFDDLLKLFKVAQARGDVIEQGVAEGIFDRFKKKPAQPEVSDPGNYPRIGSDIAQWMADTVEYHKSKFPDSVWKLFCPTYPDYLPVRVRVGTSEKTMHQHLDDYINLRNQNPEAVRVARQKFDKNNTYPSGPREDYTNKVSEQGVAEGSDSYTVANDPDKPGMHSYREVGHAVQSGHSDAAKIYKNNKFLGTVGDVRKQGVAEAPHDQEATQKIFKSHDPESIKQWVSDAESQGWAVKSSRTLPSGQIKVIMVKRQGVAEAPHDDEVDYDDKYQAMVKRVGQKAREQQRHEPVDLVKLAQRLRQADKTTDTTDEDVMESRLSAMKRAGYDIL